MLTRRTFLATGAAGLATGALAACRDTDQAAANTWPVPTAPNDPRWAGVRNQFLTGDHVVYLNNASLGMPPRAVVEAVQRGYALHGEDPIRAKRELGAAIAERSVPNLARFLGADPDEIFLTRNATEALHLAAVGCTLTPGDEVLITTQEHPAGARPWWFRQARDALDVQELFIPSPFESADQVVDLVRDRLTDRTRAIAFCHVTRGGHLYPVQRLCALARERGIATVVDGAQAVGMFPVALHELGCDAYAASLHKWLLAPIGTGVLYVRREAWPRWRSAFDPAGGASPNLAPPGTVDLPLRAAIDAAVGFVNRLGIDTVARRNRYLSDHLKARLAEIPGATILSGPTPDTSAPGSTIFELDGVDPLVAVDRLAAANLHIDEHIRDGHQAIRISTHCYNTETQIDRALDALVELRG